MPGTNSQGRVTKTRSKLKPKPKSTSTATTAASKAASSNSKSEAMKLKPQQTEHIVTAASPSSSLVTTTPTPTVKPIFFYRGRDPDSGFLCQWNTTPFPDPDDPSIVYKTAEHYMMFQKALLFDPESGPPILEAANPRRAKALGSQVRNFDDEVWNAKREEVVRKGNALKFSVGEMGPALGRRLLATGDRELVEASPKDRVWGIGFAPERSGAVDRSRWGLNLLGRALMDVRDGLRKGKEEGGEEEEEEEEKAS